MNYLDALIHTAENKDHLDEMQGYYTAVHERLVGAGVPEGVSLAMMAKAHDDIARTSDEDYEVFLE